jgi:DNA-directed RNA polymerase alpha subunit
MGNDAPVEDLMRSALRDAWDAGYRQGQEDARTAIQEVLNGVLSPREHLLSQPVTTLQLSERPRNCLARAQINTIGALTAKTVDDLLAITNFGMKSVDEVSAKLAEHGLHLAG